MRRFIAILSTCIALSVSSIVVHGQANEVVAATSPNGQDFHFYAMPGTEKVTFQTAWRSNWYANGEINAATPALGAQLMLAGGADGMNPQEVQKISTELGLQSNIAAGVGMTLGILSVPIENLDEAIKLSNSVIVKPTLDPRWMGRIQDGLQEQQNQMNELSTNQGWNAVRYAILGDQPIRETLSMNTPDLMTSITIEEVQRWHSETFQRSSAVSVIVGDITLEEAGLALDKLQEGMPAGAAQNFDNDIATDFSPKTILLHLPEVEKASIGFIGKIPATVAIDEFEDVVAGAILGGGPNSRLFNAIRTELGAAYAFQALSANYTSDIKVLIMAGEVDAEKLIEVRDAVIQTYDNFLSEGIIDAELTPLKGVFGSNISQAIQDPTAIAGLIHQQVLNEQPVARALNIADEIQEMSAAAINDRLANHYPSSDELIVVAVSSDKDALPGACVITAMKQVDECQ